MIWLVLLGVTVILFYIKFVKPLNIWKERGIPHKKGWPVAGNNLKDLFGLVSFPDGILETYKEFRDKRYNGYFHFMVPFLWVSDLDLIKQITVKNFDHFTDHFQNFSVEVDTIFSKNLFFMKGQPWKEMRSVLSPIFTSAKLKGMFPFMNKCGEQFTEYYLSKKENMVIIEVKDAFRRFSNDIIASTAFGITLDSLKDGDNEFYVMGSRITNFKGVQGLKFALMSMCPLLLKVFNIPLIPKSLSNYFQSIIVNNIRERETKGIVRPDLIHLLMQARKGQLKHEENVDPDAGFATVEEFSHGKGDIKLELTDELLTAQALIFFFAGFDTVSSAMTFVAYELALNQDVQDKLREEIDAALEGSNGSLSYDQLLKLKYLDMVISESLRKWPPSVFINRQCVKDFIIEPTRTEEKPYRVQVRDGVVVPVYAIHRDPKYYPNPEKFDPERFSDDNKRNIVPYSYIPFGSGPRICIGSRFALMEMKILISQLVSKFKIEVVEKTPIPMKFEKNSFNFNAEGGIWVGLRPRQST